MAWFTGIPIIGDVLGKVLDRVAPDKTKSAEQQTDINKAEVQGAPSSILRLWRSFLGWVLALVFAWEVVGRSVVLTYWPDTTLPPPMLEEVSRMLLAMLGLGF